MTKIWKGLLATLCFVAISTAYADVSVPINLTAPNGVGKSIGTITAVDTKYGLLLTPKLTGLTPGIHGFHVHQNPACEDNGKAAGAHLDPMQSGKHLGPYNEASELGDLPVLIVDQNGNATTPVLAPRLKLSDIMNHSFMIHVGGDNYSENPPLGGGGARIACGVIK